MAEHSIAGSGKESRPAGWIVSGLVWVVLLLMLVLLAWVGIQRAGVALNPGQKPQANSPFNLLAAPSKADIPLPLYAVQEDTSSVVRMADMHTSLPEKRPPYNIYEVQPGDSITSIAKTYHIKPETVFFANYDLLFDNTNNLTIGQKLKIPPVDGVLYQWKRSDTLDKIAYRYHVKVDDIVTWPDNHIDISDPQIPANALVMIPGGTRDLIQQAVIATIWKANSGATKDIGSGCDTSKGTYVGSGTFGWPTDNHSISGNDFWSGHLGLDIAAADGAPVYAADSGVVVYAGGISGGYGLMVMIDHGNGFHTLYAHNSQIMVQCGQNVGKGQVISYAGSTGNSTGPHLHFEIRYNGMFVNPWDYLR